MEMPVAAKPAEQRSSLEDDLEYLDIPAFLRNQREKV
jgi:hypothetical protein